MVCSKHPERPAAGACTYNGKFYCEEDLVEVNGKMYAKENMGKVMAEVQEKAAFSNRASEPVMPQMVMSEPKPKVRPWSITLICLLLLVVNVVGLVNHFVNAPNTIDSVQKTQFVTIFLLIFMGLYGLVVLGLWRMKKWSVYVHTLFSALVIYRSGKDEEPIGLVVSLILLLVVWSQYSKME
jgi:hypothetical protein